MDQLCIETLKKKKKKDKRKWRVTLLQITVILQHQHAL